MNYDARILLKRIDEALNERLNDYSYQYWESEQGSYSNIPAVLDNTANYASVGVHYKLLGSHILDLWSKSALLGFNDDTRKTIDDYDFENEWGISPDYFRADPDNGYRVPTCFNGERLHSRVWLEKVCDLLNNHLLFKKVRATVRKPHMCYNEAKVNHEYLKAPFSGTVIVEMKDGVTGVCENVNFVAEEEGIFISTNYISKIRNTPIYMGGYSSDDVLQVSSIFNLNKNNFGDTATTTIDEIFSYLRREFFKEP